MYPGNESEKPYIRKIIQEMKERYKVAGKTVQVADKGLNCARNIYAAVVEAQDGYIFSKSVHGKGLSEKEKQWLLLENDANVYTDYRDKSGKLLFRLKSCVDTFSYKFKEIDPETGEEKETSFCVKEKRIVSYNPSLARKQKAEIMKMVDKAANYTTYKKMAREESFRITKSYLDARPVYVQKKETIYGHFLICYLSLFLLRILEIKCFKNEINAYDLVNFMRDFKVVDKGDGTYINISQNQSVNEKIKRLTGLTNKSLCRQKGGESIPAKISLCILTAALLILLTASARAGIVGINFLWFANCRGSFLLFVESLAFSLVKNLLPFGQIVQPLSISCYHILV